MYRREIKKYIKAVKKSLNPKCIVLYGSLARKDYNERSDVDLIIISDDLPEHPLERLKILFDLNNTSAPIEPLGYRSKEFEMMIEKRRVTAIFAMEEGIPLFGESYFKRLKGRYQEMKERTGLVREGNVWVPRKLIEQT